MPTGYTAYIEDGEITTGKEFLKLCTRAFGIAIDLKDEPLSTPTPISFEPDSYYKDRYERALAELERTKNMTFEEAIIARKSDFDRTVKSCRESLERNKLYNERYQKVKDEVEAWNPPTEEHVGLKEFAIAQINLSMLSEDSMKTFNQCVDLEFDDSEEATRKYITEKVEYCQKEVDRAYKYYQEELERTRSKNEWMTKFLESLEEKK